MDDPHALLLLSGLVLLLTVGVFLHMGMRSGRLERAMKRLEGLSGTEAWGVTAVPPGSSWTVAISWPD